MTDLLDINNHTDIYDIHEDNNNYKKDGKVEEDYPLTKSKTIQNNTENNNSNHETTVINKIPSINKTEGFDSPLQLNIYSKYVLLFDENCKKKSEQAYYTLKLLNEFIINLKNIEEIIESEKSKYKILLKEEIINKVKSNLKPDLYQPYLKNFHKYMEDLIKETLNLEKTLKLIQNLESDVEDLNEIFKFKKVKKTGINSLNKLAYSDQRRPTNKNANKVTNTKANTNSEAKKNEAINLANREANTNEANVLNENNDLVTKSNSTQFQDINIENNDNSNDVDKDENKLFKVIKIYNNHKHKEHKDHKEQKSEENIEFWNQKDFPSYYYTNGKEENLTKDNNHHHSQDITSNYNKVFKLF